MHSISNPWKIGVMTAVLAVIVQHHAWATGGMAEAYVVTHRTVMPHLEESLRYATTTTEYCMRNTDLSILFPILDNPSLAGCRLDDAQRQGSTTYHALRCENSNSAAGTARLTAHQGTIRGALDIRMGGKNMTFTQTVEAVRQGPCREP